MILDKKLKRGDLRDAVIDYALSEAHAGRLETMSLRKAARDLHVSSGAVYRHFADKEALFMEICNIGFDRLEEKFFAIRPEGAVARSVSQVLDRGFEMTCCYITYARENPTLWRMMFGRIGYLCREVNMKDPEKMRYTIMDAVTHNLVDLYNLGGIPAPPDIQDVRYIWSATHGAADLIQQGTRLDADNLEMICAETSKRNMRMMGYTAPLPG
jgi:AcrR family transcriptional regulator